MQLSHSALNDYISPSQACILPPKQQSETLQVQKVEINLTDCLACSGCITSAETVLVAQQSLDLFLSKASTLKTVITLSEQSRASLSAKYSLDPSLIYQKLSSFFSTHFNVIQVVDASFSRDISLYLHAQDFIQRYSNHGSLPMLASSCPGFICYAEKTHDHLLPLISTVKSPQQIMGSLVKHILPSMLNQNWTPEEIFHVSIMPCYDKKLEASRSMFITETSKDVDCVLTTAELDELLSKYEIDIYSLPSQPLSPVFAKLDHFGNLIGTEGSSSGGYLAFILRYAALHLFGIQLSPSDIELGQNGVEIIEKQGRSKNPDFKEVVLKHPVTHQVLLKFAYAYGFKNIQNIVRKLKQPKPDESFDFIEIMACPSGCINGGGQLKFENKNPKETVVLVENQYQMTKLKSLLAPEANKAALDIYEALTEDQKKQCFYTSYKAVEKKLNNMGVVW